METIDGGFRGSDAHEVFVFADDFFAGEVTAAFAKDLVFDMEAGDACLDVLLNGFGDHEGSYHRGYC